MKPSYFTCLYISVLDFGKGWTSDNNFIGQKSGTGSTALPPIGKLDTYGETTYSDMKQDKEAFYKKAYYKLRSDFINLN